MADPVGVCFGLINFVVSSTIATIGLFKNNDCEQIVQRTFLWIAFALAIVSLVCCCCCCVPECSSCNVVISILIGTLFITYLIFGVSVTSKGGGEQLYGKAYKEYRLMDYSHWLRNKVNDEKTWNEIRKCLIRHHVCKKMAKDWANITDKQFYVKSLSSIESGCCKPSNDCRFSYIAPTNWTRTIIHGSFYGNRDCQLWENDPNILCFNCQSCKAGVADKFKNNWKDIMGFKK